MALLFADVSPPSRAVTAVGADHGGDDGGGAGVLGSVAVSVTTL